MSSISTYENTLASSLGKRGVLKPIDTSGYYAINLGGLDVYNESNALYVANTAKDLFKESSHLMRRVSSGKLFNELGHPKRIPGMTDEEYMIRILTVYEDNACSHLRKIHLEDFQDPTLNNGKPFIRIIGEVKPMGQLGILVEDTFKTADSDACYSIRSITNDHYVGNIRYKNIKEIATWDYVLEPGIKHATKYYSASTEGRLIINTRMLEIAKEKILKDAVGMESSTIVSSIDRLIDISRDTDKMSKSRIHVPRSLKW